MRLRSLRAAAETWASREDGYVARAVAALRLLDLEPLRAGVVGRVAFAVDLDLQLFGGIHI